MTNHRKHERGAALVVAIFYVMIFSTLSLALFSLSSNQLLLSTNVHQGNTARAGAESGLEMLRYYALQVTLPGTTAADQRFGEFAAAMQSALSGKLAAGYDTEQAMLRVGSSTEPVGLSSEAGFYALFAADGTDGVVVRVTGVADGIERTVQAAFSYRFRQASVFDYGVATRGPVQLGNLTMTSQGGDKQIYIESLDTIEALALQNTQLYGDVYIANPSAAISMSGGQATIGGDTGQSAIDNHVQTGVPVIEFPVPDPGVFEDYADGITIDSSTDQNFYKQDGVLENVRIAAGTDPKFTGNVQITGILYIESPNVVDFGGTCDITGMIVAAGDYTDDSGDNRLSFQGSVSTQSTAALPADERYDGLREVEGIFLMAPGFAVSFGGSFDTLNGCIVANGVDFFGSAGGQIDGTILNYSTETMQLRGGDLLLNRSQTDQSLTGFIPDIELQFAAASYEEVH